MDYIVIKGCKLMQKVLSVFHKGSSYPGKVALKYNKSILKSLSDKYKVILVTGTNGKTTTASILAQILRESGYPVIHNATGANMLPGITTLFIAHEGDKEKKYAVIEIDEANVPLYTSVAKAEYIICTNIFKDQLDRYGEIYTTLRKIKDGIKKLPNIKMVLNGDEPLFGDIEGKKVYFGFNQNPHSDREEKSNVEGQFCVKCRAKYDYEFYTYNHLGKYKCPKCGYKRPQLKYYVSSVNIKDDDHVNFKINDTIFIEANIGGLYNVYNILAAAAVAMEIGVRPEMLKRSIKSYKARFGRTESFMYNDKEIKIILVKNPAGFNQGLMIPTYNKEDKCGCFILNDDYADGRDISWIWDVDFENTFTDYNNIFISGSRRYDMAVRLNVAGYNLHCDDICDTIDMLVEKIKKCDNCKYVYIFSTYTAMLNLRKVLAEQNIIEHSW